MSPVSTVAPAAPRAIVIDRMCSVDVAITPQPITATITIAAAAHGPHGGRRAPVRNHDANRKPDIVEPAPRRVHAGNAVAAQQIPAVTAMVVRHRAVTAAGL